MFWPFTVWINCSSDLNFLQILDLRSFSWSLKQFFLTVGQNSFGKKNTIPFNSLMNPAFDVFNLLFFPWKQFVCLNFAAYFHSIWAVSHDMGWWYEDFQLQNADLEIVLIYNAFHTAQWGYQNLLTSHFSFSRSQLFIPTYSVSKIVLILTVQANCSSDLIWSSTSNLQKVFSQSLEYFFSQF